MDNTFLVDLVTVFHNDKNRQQASDLRTAVARSEPQGGYRFITVDNTRINRGFARACNLGALGTTADAPIIGFLNPDLVVRGPFIDTVTATIAGGIVITGSRFNKPDVELRAWGCTDWVCGAALFVKRNWFAAVGGFDEQFEWSFEETDLVRRAESQGLTCRSIQLPFEHQSPIDDNTADIAYKHTHFNRSAQRYYQKWGRNR